MLLEFWILEMTKVPPGATNKPISPPLQETKFAWERYIKDISEPWLQITEVIVVTVFCIRCDWLSLIFTIDKSGQKVDGHQDYGACLRKF